ncbi:GldL-related protein [Flavobacterium caeni]|uniref:Gliding motility protein GldL-like N-terminal domain-containing protein n=1 Tax=Flavobacterium caeni TaxID=490189 RepID=A0A1G5JJS5_9FLAO|nr:hypothetical protein [Flavobacterium caeni]SCY88424.1 hypothetical protein SAMN02927903_02747 [Flavobacterium caeni]
MKTEKILGSIFILGLLFKLLHWPGGSFFIIISLGILMMVYFPFGFYFLSGKTIKDQNAAASIFAGMFLSTPVVGILFALMHWPGAMMMLMIGLMGAVPLTIVVFILRSQKNKPELDDYYNKLFLRCVVITAIALLIWTSQLMGFKVFSADLPSPR